jgi:hypothetical protein
MDGAGIFTSCIIGDAKPVIIDISVNNPPQSPAPQAGFHHFGKIRSEFRLENGRQPIILSEEEVCLGCSDVLTPCFQSQVDQDRLPAMGSSHCRFASGAVMCR